MAWIVIRSVLSGLLGLVAVPVAVFLVSLILGHALDSRCGTPGDSGGCEMGAATLAIGAAPFGLIGGFLLSLIIGLRTRRAPPASGI